MDVKAYLERIGYTAGTLEVSEPTLRGLHRAHLFSVPFENLDIHLGREIVLDEDLFFDKIVARRRGGFCYELNGLFARLLEEIGFNVTMLSARVAREDGGFGPEFDHMTLLVNLNQRWLADVGFGDSFTESLSLDTTEMQVRDGVAYKVENDGPQWRMSRKSDIGWRREYLFTMEPRVLSDFVPMCRYHQTSPESHFTRGRICSLATELGRVSLTDMRLIVTERGNRKEREIEGQEEYYRTLRDCFGVDLG